MAKTTKVESRLLRLLDSARKKSAQTTATQRVLDAALQWHDHLTEYVGAGADYHAYVKAFERLKRACAQLKKAGA